MESVPSLVDDLEKSKVFIEWRQKHNDSFLSHVFGRVGPDISLKDNWDIGYYDTISGKITSFYKEEDHFVMKGEDDVFKKEDDTITALDTKLVKTSFAEAAEMIQSQIKEKFSRFLLGEGFVILQEINGNVVWNCSFITTSLVFVNVKVDAADGSVISSETINAVSRE